MAGISPDELKYMEEHADDSKVGSILASVVSCAIIAYFAVALRFYARNMVKFGIGLDDLAIVAALVYIFLGWFFAFKYHLTSFTDSFHRFPHWFRFGDSVGSRKTCD